MRSTIRILLAITLSLGIAPIEVGGEEPAATMSSQLTKLRKEITDLVGPARCMNLVQCRVAAIGIDSCGGPAEYLVYSWLSTDKGALETKIAEYNFLQEDLQKEQQSPANCAVLPEPTAACVNGRCVLPGRR
ncbi:MAG TPA: hypothetical protein VGR01_00990 [Burkholderiales bacterium]|jgi:hypothetical protein|nr:hypothetical protein [Burkholderiales bacterium]